MSFLTAELGFDKSVNKIKRKAGANHACAEAKHVGVIVDTRQACAEGVGAASGTNTLVLVGGNRNANTGAADENTEVGLACQQLGAKLVALSALMTTTVPAMEETIKLIKASLPDCKIMVGGAVLNPEYADKIGADAYGRDAMEAVRYAQEVFSV